MENRSQKLLTSLKEYYKDVEKLKLMENIIHAHPNSNKVSLRLVDWLVTNYSKSHNVVYYVNDIPFNVHQSYKNMLKAYSKKLFDPFRRHTRVYIDCTFQSNKLLETTVAQLTFFKWAIDNNVLGYAMEYKDAIKKDMDANTKHRMNNGKLPPDSKNKIKRKELSKSSRGANMYSVNIRVTFS